jgi:hypothetical protein
MDLLKEFIELMEQDLYFTDRTKIRSVDISTVPAHQRQGFVSSSGMFIIEDEEGRFQYKSPRQETFSSAAKNAVADWCRGADSKYARLKLIKKG